MLTSIRSAAAGFFGLRAPRVRLPKYARSKYMPHIGAKERERAKRTKMIYFTRPFPIEGTNLASAHELCSPIMNQMSKRTYEGGRDL